MSGLVADLGPGMTPMSVCAPYREATGETGEEGEEEGKFMSQ